MRADSTGTGTGTIDMPGRWHPIPARINWTGNTGTITLYYNPTTVFEDDRIISAVRERKHHRASARRAR